MEKAIIVGDKNHFVPVGTKVKLITKVDRFLPLEVYLVSYGWWIFKQEQFVTADQLQFI